AYLASVLANVNDAILATDARFHLTAWNRAAEKIYGWQADEVMGRDVHKILHTEFAGMNRGEALDDLQASGHFRGEMARGRKDGEPLDSEGSRMQVPDEHGQIAGYVSVNRDITERKQAEEALRRSEAQFRAIAEASPVGIFLIDLDGNVVYGNPAGLRMMG